MVSFIYFDVGGVAMLDFSKTNKWNDLKLELGVTPENDILFEQVWAEYSWNVCLDRDVDTLVPILREQVGLPLEDNYSLFEGFMQRFEVNPNIEPLVNELKNNYSLGLLTNMYPRLLDSIMERNLIPKTEWDAIVDSSVVGYQKPDLEIFYIAQDKAGVKPEYIMFVENTEAHIKTAKKLGWQTFLYDPSNPEKSTQELRSLL